jgi:NADPH:quinone reductase-like Zn-dependent oxidoreductase
MRAVRLHSATGPEGLVVEELPTPEPDAGEAVVRVHAAAITRDELEWPTDRLPAIPSYELSGVVAAVAPDVREVAVGDEVYALTPFDRDGVAAEYASVPADVLAPRPRAADHVTSAAIPLAALTAWQGLFDHGALEPEQRVLITGAAGGVGQFATQLARRRGAHVIGVASPASADRAASLGAHEVVAEVHGIDPVDLVFDTAGGALLERASALVRDGGRVVSVAQEPPAGGTYFVVEPNREQLDTLARLVDDGELHVQVDSVYPLTDARAAFERAQASGKRGKVVLDMMRESRI